MSHTLLIVHPDASVRALMESMLQTMGHRIEEVANDRAALRKLDREPVDLILAGLDPSDADVMEFLDYVRRKHPRTPVILLSTSTQPDRAREMILRGAVSVLRFPMPAVQLRAAVAQVLGPESGQAGNGRCGAPEPHEVPVLVANHNTKPASNGSSERPYTNGSGVPAPEASGIIGDDPSVRQALEVIGTIAPTRTPVLIVGERGAGKTLLARALHNRGPRREAPFIEVTCSSLSEPALEAELFGRKGNGAEGELVGKLSLAQGGTLVLDDVGALSPGLQHRMLRVLQDSTFEPVGSCQTSRADVRLVLSTREDLATAVELGTFRPDLYYRISVVTMKLPPLRHRTSDVDKLAEHFRVRIARQIGREGSTFSTEALARLREHHWPGNVRELEQAVERALLQARGSRIEPSHLTLNARSPDSRPARVNAFSSRSSAPSSILPLKEALEGPERQLILQALEALNWNRQETARVLDINRTTLYKKMKKYGLLFDEPVWAN